MKTLSIIQRIDEAFNQEMKTRYVELGEIEVDDKGEIAFTLFRGLTINARLVVTEDKSKFQPLTSYKQVKK